MGLKPSVSQSGVLFQQTLLEILNLKHLLLRLADVIDWEEMERIFLINRQPNTAIVDKGYQGFEFSDFRMLRSGQRSGINRPLNMMIKRSSAIEQNIGHMKTDGRLDRNRLKGALRDALHAVLCGAGHNIRLLLKKLRLFCAEIRQWILAFLYQSTQPLIAAQ